jgi:cytochrome b561
MLVALRFLLVILSALAVLSAGLVLASLGMADRAPVSDTARIISFAVAAVFAGVGVIALGVERQIGRLASLDAVGFRADGARLEHVRDALVRWLLLACLLCVPLMGLVTWAILARIDEGFAVFG